jgi:outer membrane protein assembly factor BamB
MQHFEIEFIPTDQNSIQSQLNNRSLYKTRFPIPNSIMRKIHLLALPILITLQTLKAEEWTSFRGPQGTGVTLQTNVPTKWDSKSIVWKTNLPGVGQSSPIHWDGKLFLTTATDGGKTRHTLCVDKASGKILWNQSVSSNSPEDVHRMNTHATPSCVTDGERVISFFGPAGLHCYDLTGKPQWSRTDLGDFPGAWGIAGSPIILGDTVIQNCDSAGPSYLLAVDKKTGKTRWKTPRNEKPKGGWSTPILINTGSRNELVLNGEFGVKGYDPQNGRELWFCKSFNGRGSPVPFFAHGLVYTVNGKPGDIYVVKPGGSGDVTKTRMAWHAKRRGGRDLPAPAVIGNHVLVTAMSGVTSCYDAKTGADQWPEAGRIDGAFSGAPLIANGLYYIQNEAGTTYVLRPGKKLDVVARNALPSKPGEIFRATIVPVDGKVFLRSSKALYCVSGS